MLWAQDLYEPRFRKLSEEQRALLREAIEPNKKLEKLYANFSCRGHRRIIEPATPDNTAKFDYAVRSDGYLLYRRLDVVDGGREVPVGQLGRPEGFVATTLKPGSASPAVETFGVDPMEKPLRRFRYAPYCVVSIQPFSRWLTDEAVDIIGLVRSEAVDLIVHPADPEKGVIVTLKMEYPVDEKWGSRATRSIDFLKDHSWAILRTVFEETSKEGVVWTHRKDVEYDLSKDWPLRMTRVTETMFEPGTVEKVRNLEDFHFEELDFATPDLKRFEPESLGLSIPVPATAKTSVWPWRLGMIGGGIVLVSLALYLRRRMRA